MSDKVLTILYTGISWNQAVFPSIITILKNENNAGKHVIEKYNVHNIKKECISFEKQICKENFFSNISNI